MRGQRHYGGSQRRVRRRRHPFYWLVWLSDDHVLSMDIHMHDHTLGYYRLFARSRRSRK